MTFLNEGTFSRTLSVEDLPAILKGDNLQSLDKALDFFIELKFSRSDFYFLNRRKNVRWPLITSSQCISGYPTGFKGL